MIFTTVETSLYLYFSRLCQVYPQIARKCKSWGLLSRNRFCLLDGKILNKSPDHLFDLNFFDSMIHTIVFQASVQSFLISVAEVPRKNFPFSAILFFSASVPVFL